VARRHLRARCSRRSSCLHLLRAKDSAGRTSGHSLDLSLITTAPTTCRRRQPMRRRLWQLAGRSRARGGRRHREPASSTPLGLRPRRGDRAPGFKALDGLLPSTEPHDASGTAVDRGEQIGWLARAAAPITSRTCTWSYAQRPVPPTSDGDLSGTTDPLAVGRKAATIPSVLSRDRLALTFPVTCLFLDSLR